MKMRSSASLVSLAFMVVSSCNTYDASLLGSRATNTAAAGAGVAVEAAGGLAGSKSNDVGGDVGGVAGSATVGGGGDQAGSSSGAGGKPTASGGDTSQSGEAGQAGAPTIEQPPMGEGWITHEHWQNVKGSALSDFPTTAPDSVTTLKSFKVPATAALDTADRISGFLTAPADGNYRFWIACDDNCELWLSSDQTVQNEAVIASLLGVDRWTDPDQWSKFASQESRLVSLQAGKQYRIKAVVKQGIGGTNLSVGWLKPGQSGVLPSEVIPGAQLSPLP